MVVNREIGSADGVGTVVAVRRWLNVCVADGVANHSTCILGFRPCHTRTCGRRELFVLNIGGMSGGREPFAVYSGRPEMVRSVVRDRGDRGGRRSITVSYVLCCRVGWMAFDVVDTCRKCVKDGPKLGDQGFSKMPEATAIILLEECARVNPDAPIRPLTHASVDRAHQAELVGSNSLVSILIAICRSPNL